MPILLAHCDPDLQDTRAKAAQRDNANAHGGPNGVGQEAFVAFAPPPGVCAEEAWVNLEAVAGAAN